MFIETIEDRVLFPLRSMTRITCTANEVALIQDSDPKSNSKEVSSVFRNPPPIARYEPPLCLYSYPYLLFKVGGPTFLIPAKKHWKHDIIFHRAEDASISSPPENLSAKANQTSNPTVSNLTT